MNNAAVLDKETGLVWERSPAPTFHTWSSAVVECTGRTTGNRKGWRLPSVHELASLVDPSVTPGPTLSLDHPFVGVLSADYWSASSYADHPSSAWSVFFDNGAVNFNIDKTVPVHAWCVRGGMNADQY
jgi:hypothetical protein